MSGALSMQQVNIHEVRENLAEYLAAAERGEEVLICRRNQPVARLVAVEALRPRKPRPIGKAPDAGVPLPPSFFEPMPDGWNAAFDAGLVSAPKPTPARRAPARKAKPVPAKTATAATRARR